MADNVEAAIQASIEGLEGRDADPDNFGETVPGGTDSGPGTEGTGEVANETGVAKEPPPVSADPAKIADIEDKLAKELGIDPKRKVNNIPYPRVKEITSNRERKLLETAATKFGLKPEEIAKLSFDQLDTLFDTHHTQKISKYDADLAGYKSQLDEVSVVEKLMAADDRKFLEALATEHPTYRRYIEAVDKLAEMEKQKTGGGVDQDAEPALTDAQGNTSVDMIRANTAWHIKQNDKKWEQKYSELDKTYKPLIERQRAAELSDEATGRMVQTITNARTNWPGFAESEKEILEAFGKNKEWSVRDAYNEVRLQKMQRQVEEQQEAAKAAEKKGREALMKELKDANPSDTSMSSVADPSGKTAAKSIEDIIREQLVTLRGR